VRICDRICRAILIRQYFADHLTLCASAMWLRQAVMPEGRGGSRWLHDQARRGQTL